MAQKQTSGTHFPPGEALPVGYPLRGVQGEWGGQGVKVHGRWGMVVMGLDEMKGGGLPTNNEVQKVHTESVEFERKG